MVSAREEPDRPSFTRRRAFQFAAGGLAGLMAWQLLRSGIGPATRRADWSSAYGPLRAPDALGVALPAGFTARLIGRAGDAVGATGHLWHSAPDGGACFPVRGTNHHIYVSNSEVASGLGGVSAVRFDGGGEPLDAYSILTGTSRNCAGGATPWGTWLSCEENGDVGQVWECDPLGGPAVVRRAMGAFNHEAAAVDAVGQQVFLTEDHPVGRLYRFLPTRWPDLGAGVLQAATVADGVVSWLTVDPARPDRSPDTRSFDGAEGAVVDGRRLVFATKGDRRIWQLDLVTGRLIVLHDSVVRDDSPLTHADNLADHPVSGSLLAAEDGGDMELSVLARTAGAPVVASMLRFVGHDGSEVAGPAFSPDGQFLYVSSQRGTDGRGITVQVRGPFSRLAASFRTGVDSAGLPDSSVDGTP